MIENGSLALVDELYIEFHAKEKNKSQYHRFLRIIKRGINCIWWKFPGRRKKW